MSYITIVTAAGKRLMVQPKKEKSLMFDLQDAAVAECRLDDRRLRYAKYRVLREMPAVDLHIVVTFAQSMKRDFSYVNKDDFRKIDHAVLELCKNPCSPDTQVKHYRWFRGNLRRKMIGNFPLIYMLSDKGDNLILLRLGVRRWLAAKSDRGSRLPKSTM